MSEEIIYSRTGSKECDLNDNPESSILMSEMLSSDNIDAERLIVCRQEAFLAEYIDKNYKFINYVTGSSIDVSYDQDSDFDRMFEFKSIDVTDVENCKTSQADIVLVMETNNCTPGYTLLRLYRLPPYQTLVTNNYFFMLLCSCVPYKDDTFSSSERFIEYVIQKLNEIDDIYPKCSGMVTRNGPCFKMKFDHIEEMNADGGIGIKCTSWPKDAMEWISRRRQSNWPGAALIDKIKTMPCHVLPVGYPDSDKCSLEWRFAFVLQERELIWNFNNVQIQCLVIFKTLKKAILDKIAPDEINSFHLKTILFWLSEKSITWERSTLLNNVRRCFNFLNKCIHERHLSHYFLRSRNIFAGKLGNKKIRTCLSAEIFRIQENILECLMGCDVRYYPKMCFSIKSVSLSLKEKRQLSFQSMACFALNHMQTKYLIYAAHKYTNPVTVSSTFAHKIMSWQVSKKCWKMEKIMDEVGDMLQNTLLRKYTLKILSIRKGMVCLVEATATVDTIMRQNLLSEAKCFLEAGLGHDVLAAPMYLLTYYYLTKSYDAMGTFFEGYFSRRLSIVYKGSPYVRCGKRNILSPDMDKFVTMDDIKNENDVAVDVVFVQNDVSCLPPALHYECALLNGGGNYPFCSFNPLVYACYVKFQVAFDQRDSEQSQLSLDHLRNMILYIENDDSVDLLREKREKRLFLESEGIISRVPRELHRHYNLLGYCYYVKKDIRNAIQWFVKSLEACPTIGNAAAYHLCIALFDAGFPQTNFI